MPSEALAAEKLRVRFTPEDLPFDTTASLEPIDGTVGQERALDALAFGVGMDAEGYNLFVLGESGVGRHTIVRAAFEARAARGPVPRDVCYVQDFAHPERPRAILLPPGRANTLRDDVAQLVSELRKVLQGAFEGEEFQREKRRIEEEAKRLHEARLSELKTRAEGERVAVVPTPMGFALAPIRGDHIVDPEEFEKLPDEDKARFTAALERVKRELHDVLEDLPRVQKKLRVNMRSLVEATVTGAIRHHVEDLKKDWKDEPAVLDHLAALERDVCDNVEDFLKSDDEGPIFDGASRSLKLRRYQVNVLVDHGATRATPVVYENHPTYPNLIGRVEHLQQLGALVTDVGLIKPGALHRANGGCLILDARALLTQPFAWDGLKRALLAREVRIEAPGQAYALMSTVSLEPEPVPLALRVALIGEREVYHLLDRFDPDFRTMFKVVVDFDDAIERTPESTLRYARLLGSIARAESLPPLDRGAVARVLAEAVRLAGDTRKLSACVRDAFDIAREAAYFARGRASGVVTGDDVERAIDAQERRSGRARERTLEGITQGTMMIDTDGRRVGQVNGLCVFSVGRSTFGRPARITARVRLGRGEVVDVEREVELGGPIHSKGVMILGSFLGSRYATEAPLSLRASLVFEQSYGMVEGDSASCAELCALLSALADVPLRQDTAITGSVNQHGEVQAIGGVNEKIEGFFDVCQARGLTGSQGVIVPRANVRHLSLRDAVVRAVEAGKFRVWAVATVDEAIELLTETPAGARGDDGRFPAGSLNAKVEARLVALADRRSEIEKARTA